MRKLTCHCEQVFNVDLPESVNLDTNPEIVCRYRERRLSFLRLPIL